MKEQRPNKTTIFVLLASVVACIGVTFIILSFLSSPKHSAPAETGETLLKNELPVSPLYKNIAAAKLTDAQGKAVSLNGTCSVLFYWASWCPDCGQVLPLIDQTANLVKEAGANFYLVNRTESGKETMQSAEDALKQAGVATTTLYDIDRKAYDEIGLSMIPSTVILDKSGMVVSVLEGALPEEAALLAMISEAQEGKAAYLSNAIQKNMLTEDGGVKTELLSEDERVLSESQGLMMLCEQGELFGRLYDYVKAHPAGGGLASWDVSGASLSPVNAAIDDLRIVRALAQNGGYESDVAAYAASLYEYNTANGKLVDFYDFGSGQKADRFTLCYADFEALSFLASYDKRFEDVKQDALTIVEGGYLADDFPLYKSWYNYATGMYPSGELNMAEALTTLYHLSRIGELSQTSLDWLRARIAEGQIWAVYDESGKPLKRYESTGVYGLVAQIAVSEGDFALAAAAIEKMDSLKVRDVNSAANGLFGNADGSGVYSFDQLTALCAYRAMDKAIGGAA